MEIERSRLGVFFILVGLVLLVIFFTTDQSKTPGYGFFFAGIAALYLGGALFWRSRKPPAEEPRFRTLRRIRQKHAARKSRKNDE